MPVFLRVSLALLLSTTIVITGTPFQLMLKANANSAAESAPDAAAEAEADVEIQKNIAQLKEAFTGDVKGDIHLDPFRLTTQRVIDNRMANLEAIEREEKIQDYVERVEYFQRQIEEIKELRVLNEQKLAESKTETQRIEHRQFADELNSRQEIAQMELDDLKDFDPRKGDALPVDHMIDKELKTKHYWGNKMTLLIEQNGEVINEVRQVEFTESLKPTFNKKNPLSVMAEGGDLHFTIADNKGHAMNQFFKPVEALFFFGHYIVFIEKEARLRTDGVLPIRFIDLRYARTNIGNAQLPVFTMPFKADAFPEDIRIKDGYLSLDGKRISYQQIDLLSKVQQVMFNVSVALVDPTSYEKSAPLVEDILDFYQKAMQGQDETFQKQLKEAFGTEDYLRTVETALEKKPSEFFDGKAVIEKALQDGQITDAEYNNIKTALDAGDTIRATNGAMSGGRGLMTRIRLMIRFLMSPRPEGAPKLFNNLILLASKDKSIAGRSWEFFKNSFAMKLARYGAAAGGVALASTLLPAESPLHIYKAVEVVSAAKEHFFGYLEHMDYGKNYGILSKDAFITTTTGWTNFFTGEFAEGQWGKFLLGLGRVLAIPVGLFTAIHFTVNGWVMTGKTIKLKKLSNGQLSFLKAFKEAAALSQVEYWKGVADAEKIVSGSNVEDMSEKDVRLLEEYLQWQKDGRESLDKVRKEIERGKYGRQHTTKAYFKTASGIIGKFRSAKKIEETFEDKAQEMKVKSVDSLRAAVSSTFFSYASLVSTFRFNALLWNPMFMIRSYFWSPPKWLMFFVMPNYFNVAVYGSGGEKQHFPSRYNRGLHGWGSKLQRGVSKLSHSFGTDRSFMKPMFISKEALENLGDFEKSVIKAEVVAMEVAKSRAEKALIRQINDPERLMKIFSSTDRPGEVSTGISNLHDKKLKQLTRKERIYYRAIFTRTFDLMMQGFVKELTPTDLSLSMNPEQFAKEFVNQVKAGQVDEGAFTDENVQRVKDKIKATVDYRDVMKWAVDVTTKAEHFFKRVELGYRHKLLETIHPGDKQVARYSTVRKKVYEPRAMIRAMREEVSTYKTGIPIGIATSLALYAGVDTGMLDPFDPNGFNTDTHYRYMSRYLFYNGFVMGLLIGLLANTWMKVQEDARIDAKGGFSQVVKFADSKRSFWRYYAKNLFKNPVNKWKDAQLFYMSLIIANIPAAAVTIIFSNLVGLGRIDVGVFLTGYIVMFSTVFMGFGFKMNQALELGMSWFSEKIPRRFRAHPKAQKMITDRTYWAKVKVNLLVENIYGIIFENNLIGSMVTLKDNPIIGTRAFERLQFGGLTMAELIVNSANGVRRALEFIPGIDKAMDSVIWLFSNRYEAFERFPERLPMPPDGVQRVMENPNLPKNVIGETLGKAGGWFTTMGIVTFIPYGIVGWMQNRRERRLQDRGTSLKALPRLMEPGKGSGAAIRCSAVFK